MRTFTDLHAARDTQFMNGGTLVELSDHRYALVHDDDAETHHYEIIDLEATGAEECSIGTTATLDEAYDCVEFVRLKAWQIWRGYVDGAGDFVGTELIDHSLAP